jgi:hypothetical protein
VNWPREIGSVAISMMNRSAAWSLAPCQRDKMCGGKSRKRARGAKQPIWRRSGCYLNHLDFDLGAGTIKSEPAPKIDPAQPNIVIGLACRPASAPHADLQPNCARLGRSKDCCCKTPRQAADYIELKRWSSWRHPARLVGDVLTSPFPDRDIDRE